jgi:hypothetical protein
MMLLRKEHLTGIQGVPKGSTTDLKRAVVFATCGVPLDPATGIFISRAEGAADRLDGKANFTFLIKAKHFHRLNRIYDRQTADTELDAVLDEFKASTDPRVAHAARTIELYLIDGLLTWGRHFIENYQRMVACIKSNAPGIEISEEADGAFTFVFRKEPKK